MRVRDWTGADHYRVLGVAPTATRDEITQAYRAQARVLHPDTGPSDPAAEEQFVRVTAAYQILTGPLREEYDRARRRGQVRRPVPAPAPDAARGATGTPTVAASGAARLSRTGARRCLWGGIALIVVGVVAAVVVVALAVRDAHLRSEGIAARAVVVRVGGVPKLEFTTASGKTVRADLPDTKSGAYGAGDRVEIRYDRADPTHVVTASSNLARDITLWLVAAKLLIVGAVLAIVGGRRLLRPDA